MDKYEWSLCLALVAVFAVQILVEVLKARRDEKDRQRMNDEMDAYFESRRKEADRG